MSKNKRTVAIHQPNYLPWIGYFYKMINCDIFVYLDAVQYPRGQSFAARNRIKNPNGASYLTIPTQVPHGRKGKATYLEIKFADERWREKHLKSITLNYKKAPYFQEVFDLLQPHLEKHSQLVDLNIALIEAIADYLEIPYKTVRLSELLPNFRQKSELIVDICQALDANTYLSGDGGGKNYNDSDLLSDQDITLTYAKFEHPEYPQLWKTFESHLSIVDALFNCGRDTRNFLLQEPEIKVASV